MCAILGSVLGYPSGGYSNQYAQIPVRVAFAAAPQQIPLYKVSAPVQPIYVSQAAAPYETKVIEKRPIITGTLHHSQDTYGQYKYGYTSSDGQEKSESREADGKVDGQFSYTSPEGHHIKLNYEAGKDGFFAFGDHLPVAPELPEELAIAYREANDRLAHAYEEARLRGDVEESEDEESDEGKQEEDNKVDQKPEALPQFAPVYNIYPPRPVGTPVVSYQPIQTPVQQTYYVSAPAPAPVQLPAQKLYYVSLPSASVAAAPKPHYAQQTEEHKEKEESKEGHSADEGEKEEKKTPVPYIASSYSADIGGAPVAAIAKPEPKAPSKSHYY